MNYELFMEAVVDALLFIDFSGPETVNEDSAVQIMEQIVATLQKLSPTDKDQFLSYLNRRASQAEGEKERRWLETLAEDMGLIGD